VQISARHDQFPPKRQPMGVRVMLLTDQPEGQTASRLASYGSLVETEAALPAALSNLLEDRIGFDLFVMDCDAFGGISAAERAIAALIAADARMRVMLVSAEFDTPAYPLGRRSAVCLPDAVPEGDFRYGFDHVLRDRTTAQMM
jgi:hypothetical protein